MSTLAELVLIAGRFCDRKQRSIESVPWYLSGSLVYPRKQRDSCWYGRRRNFRYYDLFFHYRTDL